MDLNRLGGKVTGMISEVYEAFRAAGVPDDQAKAAVEAIAENDNRFTSIERKLTEFDGRFTLLQWMVGLNLIFTMAIAWKIFS